LAIFDSSQYVSRGWPADGIANEKLNKLYKVKDRLTACHGYIMYDNRLYVPTSLRRLYLARLHEHHQGVEKTKRLARQLVWWPGLSVEIADYIARCDTCIKHSAVKHQPLQRYPLPGGPWQEIATDVFVFTGQLYLVIVDYYTRWIEAPRLSAQSACAVVDILKNVFCRMGVPYVVRSDNAMCYASREMKSFAAAWGFKLITSSPRYPQSNGMAERAVGTVKRLWSKCSDKEGALLAYLSTPLKSGYSPNQLMYGRGVRSTLGSPRVTVDYDLFEQTEQAGREQSTAKWNKKHRAHWLPPLQPGQRVWVNAPSDVGKEGVVVRADSNPESYWVQVGVSEIRRNRKHLFVLHGCSDSSEEYSNMLPLSLEDGSSQEEGNSSVSRNDSVLPSVPSGTSVANTSEVVANPSLPASVSASSANSEVALSANNAYGSGSGIALNNTGLSDPVRVNDNSSSGRLVVTRSGRVVKPPKRDDFVSF
jgi:transposase InsO family protein